MPTSTPHVIGPLGRRITRLAASPNGEYLVIHQVPQNYDTRDYHWTLFRQSSDTYEQIGGLPAADDIAPLDDGQCLLLVTDYARQQLARWALTSSGMAEVARWNVWSTISMSDAALRLMPSGRDALMIVIDRDDKQADWGGGPPPDYIHTSLLVDIATGEVREKTYTVNLDTPEILREAYGSSRGTSVLVAVGAPPWVGTRAMRECAALQKIILPLTRNWDESAIRAGPTRLLTNLRAIDIASGEKLLRIPHDPKAVRFEANPRFHDLSPDENYALSTVADGHFALWNISYQSAWQPELPAHGGVHNAIFLPGGRAALGTKSGGVIVVDCADGIAPGDPPW